jgi:hypothetical protein
MVVAAGIGVVLLAAVLADAGSARDFDVARSLTPQFSRCQTGRYELRQHKLTCADGRVLMANVRGPGRSAVMMAVATAKTRSCRERGRVGHTREARGAVRTAGPERHEDAAA